MIDHDEIIRLHRIHDLAHIGRGEFAQQVRGQQARQWLCHDHAVRTSVLERLRVGGQELRALFQHGLHQLRFLIAEDHDLVHVHQASRQRERPDHAREHRPVRDLSHDLPDGFDVEPCAPRAHFGHGKLIRIGILIHDGAHHRGHLFVRHHDLAAERFRLNGQIHERNGCSRGERVGDDLHGLRLLVRGIDELLHRDAHLLDGRERQHRHRLLPVSGDDASNPFIHVHENPFRFAAPLAAGPWMRPPCCKGGAQGGQMNAASPRKRLGWPHSTGCLP